MDRLYRFTSSTNRVNHGIIVELIANTECPRELGGANVIFDAFAVNDKVTLPMRFAYVSFEPNPFVNPTSAKSEVLPMAANVPWQESWIADLAKMVRAGTFDAWWAENAAGARERLMHRYRE